MKVAMAKLFKSCLFVILVSSLAFGSQVHAVPYDHKYTHECLDKPHEPQYGGGIVVNPELNEGLKGWTNFGEAKIEHRHAQDGNKFIVASNRNLSFHSFTQKFYLEKEKLYTFSAWLRVSHGTTHIAAMFKAQSSYETVGWVMAKEGCWSMLKGGLVVNDTGFAQLYFESNHSSVEVWADSISLQPFTHEEWRSHQHESIEKFRKRRVKFQVLDQQSRPVANATISIKQTRSRFPLGCAINHRILDNASYQKWFTSRFKYTVFENELKWYATTKSRESEDYSVSDALVGFAKDHNVAIRGHNVFWDDPSYQPYWVGQLSNVDLLEAADKRIKSVMSRYSGQLFHWDVVNENMHFSFFESKFGSTASSYYYQQANLIDPNTTPFLNEYNTIEESGDESSTPSKYLNKISEIRQQGYTGPLGIGLEGHFSNAPNLPYIRSSLDTLASANLPIWVTELDVASGPNQATYLEQIMKELLSHHAVQGIMIWGAWSEQGCYKMCLTDNNFRNLETGHVVDKMIWQLSRGHQIGTTDSKGFFEASFYHGEYEVAKIVNHEIGGMMNSSSGSGMQKFNVIPNEDAPGLVHFKIDT